MLLTRGGSGHADARHAHRGAQEVWAEEGPQEVPMVRGRLVVMGWWRVSACAFLCLEAVLLHTSSHAVVQGQAIEASAQYVCLCACLCATVSVFV